MSAMTSVSSATSSTRDRHVRRPRRRGRVPSTTLFQRSPDIRTRGGCWRRSRGSTAGPTSGASRATRWSRGIGRAGCPFAPRCDYRIAHCDRDAAADQDAAQGPRALLADRRRRQRTRRRPVSCAAVPPRRAVARRAEDAAHGARTSSRATVAAGLLRGAPRSSTIAVAGVSFALAAGSASRSSARAAAARRRSPAASPDCMTPSRARSSYRGARLAGLAGERNARPATGAAYRSCSRIPTARSTRA